MSSDTMHTSAVRLEDIRDAADLRHCTAEELHRVAADMRRFLVEKVSATGGHLGPNLGVVELTIALHRVFSSPRDPVLFDTGHQSYVHKILTGRVGEFDRLRKAGGLSGYPCQAESEHDFIENSHACTALSYADGMAKAFALRGEHDRRVVAVVGDGALTGGMSWEALNNIAGDANRPIVIVLNDNGRSYDPTAGALARHLDNLRQASTDQNMFESLGLAYIGPVDGHDIPAVEHALRQAALLRRAVVVHCITQKGKGYSPAENDDVDRLHAVGVVSPATGRPITPPKPTWTSVFAEEMLAVGRERPDIVCLTAAMLQPVGLRPFAEAFPGRVFDVGLAEQHAVTSAAGLAMAGLHPVAAIYATFLNRAFDQVLMDVALHRLPVTFVLDRAGITGPDGPSHHGMWDLSLLPLVPGIQIAAPRDPARLRELLREALLVGTGPTVVRFPKSSAGPDVPALDRQGRNDVLYQGKRKEVLLVAVGCLADPGVEAARLLRLRGIEATVVDPRWIAPIDTALVDMASDHRLTVVVEDNTGIGGAGARLAHAGLGSTARIRSIALPSAFLSHDSREAILRHHGLTGTGIAAQVADWFAAGPHSSGASPW